MLNSVLEETSIETDVALVTPKPERYDASGVSARLGKKMLVETPCSAEDIF